METKEKTSKIINPAGGTQDNTVQKVSFNQLADEYLGVLNKDTKNIQAILPFLLKLQCEKGKSYGRSWYKYGDMSAFFNTARKWDRLENIMKLAMEQGIENLFNGSAGTSKETVLDTIIDLSVYCLMWAGAIAEDHPELWEQFVKSNGLEFPEEMIQQFLNSKSV